MKKLYIALIVSMVVFAGLVNYYMLLQQRLTILFFEVGDKQASYGEPGFTLGVISVFFMGFAGFVAILGIQRLRKTSGLLLFTSYIMTIWAVIMAMSPKSISIDEVAIAWYAYIILTIVLGIIGVLRINKTPNQKSIK